MVFGGFASCHCFQLWRFDVCIYIQYIYIVLCYCMIVFRRVQALACPDTKGLLFSTSFQCCSGPNRLIVRISVQSHPEIPGESARHLTNHVPVSKTYIR